MSEARATAVHEAGHIVAAVRLRRPFEYGTVVANDESLGHVRHVPLGHWFQPDLVMDRRTRDRIEREIICAWAGPVAEAVHRDVPGHPSELPGSEHDTEMIVMLAERACGSAAETSA